MTDKGLIKAYEQLIDLLVKKKKVCICEQGLLEDIFDLLNRQQAEIERLKKSQRIELHIDEEFYKECQYEIKQAKSEAIKEFAERLKEHTHDIVFYGEIVTVSRIDNLVTEMTEGEKVND